MSKSLLWSLSVLMFFSALIHPAYAQDKDAWYVDNESLRFQFNGELVVLENATPCNLSKIEMQTYPTNSTSFSRMAGTGSYYYKMDTLERGKRITIPWARFTNIEGGYLDRSRYSFDRISIYATKCSGKDEKRFGAHNKLTF